MQFIVLAAIVQDTQEEKVIKIAKEAGAGSATILHGKNIGLEEKKIFFGLTLEENVSVLLFILPEKTSAMIFKALKNELNLESEENINGVNGMHGTVFTFPLTHLSGLDTQEIELFEENVKNEL